MTDFEKAVSETQEDMDMQSYQFDYENVIEFTRNAKVATVTSCQGRYVTKIKKYAEEYPDDVQITSEKKGTIVAHVPTDWVKISPPRKVNFTDERKKASIERLRKWREEQKSAEH